MSTSLSFTRMLERPDELEKLDLHIHFGPYTVHVLRFHCVQFPPGHIIANHQHAEYEFHYITDGKGAVCFENGDEISLKPGQLYLTGPGVMHTQRSDWDEPMQELCLHVDITLPSEYQQGSDQPHSEDWEWTEAKYCVSKLCELPHVPVQDSHLAMSYFLDAYDAAISSYAGNYTTIKQNVIQILIRSIRAYEPLQFDEKPPTKDMKAYRYQLAIEFMQANYMNALSLVQVSDKLRCSTRQLQRIFKELHNGSNFSQILEEIRLRAVCTHLLDTQASIEQIALNTGLTTANYLHAVFRKRYGMTPSEYRRTKL